MVATKKASKPLSCLVTGFDPFGNNASNPSQTLAEAIDGRTLGRRLPEATITGLVLPTCCQDSWKKLNSELKRLTRLGAPPDLLLLLGLDEGARRVNLERFALNVRDYRIKDNQGHLWDGDPIEKRSPAGLKTSLDLSKLGQSLSLKKLPHNVSNHAGTFVCNDIYFRALSHRERFGSPSQVLFVHVPLPANYHATVSQAASSRKNKVSEQAGFDLLLQAVTEVIVASLRQL